VLTILRDVTERQVLEDRLRQAQKMEAIGQLAGGVAHDFNNLLTVITSYSGVLLMEMAPDAPRRGEIQEIADAADRAGVLTRQLLAFSRQQVLQLQVIDVNDVVRDMKQMLSRLIPANIHLTTKLEVGVGHVYADPGQIEQVLMNLVVNARDAMPAGGTITIESARARVTSHSAELHVGAREGSYVVLSVSDTGHGMTAEQQEHIFEPFYTTKKVGEGTGLGLATVYGIVKQSNGHMGVYSEVDRGTMFTIYLPLVDQPIARRTPTLVLAEGARSGETVLLAEDGRQVRAAARQILERAGFQILEAASAEEAVAMLNSHPAPIHVLLTDIVMPDMSGHELARQFRVRRPDAAVVFMSGYTQDSELLQRVLEPGIQFIQKPFTPQSLLSALRAALDRR
jgi:nitrogen-specific signal transduction histidine kinase/CheY-like chemotaxis protein